MHRAHEGRSTERDPIMVHHRGTSRFNARLFRYHGKRPCAVEDEVLDTIEHEGDPHHPETNRLPGRKRFLIHADPQKELERGGDVLQDANE